MKAHLKGSEVPLTQGEDIEADCGEKVKAAQFVFWILSVNGEFELQVYPRFFCTKCAKTENSKRYFYVVVAGQEAMSSEENSGGGA